MGVGWLMGVVFLRDFGFFCGWVGVGVFWSWSWLKVVLGWGSGSLSCLGLY